MTDIVKRLRADGALAGYYDAPAIQREAADEIERLRAERDEAIDQRNAADFVLALSIEQSTRHSAERDAARAEASRLREALGNVLGNAHMHPLVQAEAHAKAYRALAKEPGHE